MANIALLDTKPTASVESETTFFLNYKISEVPSDEWKELFNTFGTWSLDGEDLPEFVTIGGKPKVHIADDNVFIHHVTEDNKNELWRNVITMINLTNRYMNEEFEPKRLAAAALKALDDQEKERVRRFLES